MLLQMFIQDLKKVYLPTQQSLLYFTISADKEMKKIGKVDLRLEIYF